MRIELVLPSLVRAGMEVVMVELALRLKARGHDVGVTCIEQRGALEPLLREVDVRVSLVELPGLAPCVFTREMEVHLAAIRPDVVHSHSGVWLKAALAAKRAGVAGTVHTVHGLHDVERSRDRLMMFAGALATDAVVAVSHPLASYLTDRARIRTNKVSRVLNGVDHARFAPEGPVADLRDRLGLPPDAVLVGMVARFSEVKDHATLLRAFDIVRRAHPDAHLVLVGDGELRGAVEAEIDRVEMGANVHLVGSLGDTAPVYRALDIFVLSSRNEGTSMSILEALACGLPVVATEVGGTPDLMRDGVHGVLVPSQDSSRLASALGRLIGNEAERHAMGQAARQHAAANHTLDRMVVEYESIYTRITA